MIEGVKFEDRIPVERTACTRNMELPHLFKSAWHRVGPRDVRNSSGDGDRDGASVSVTEPDRPGEWMRQRLLEQIGWFRLTDMNCGSMIGRGWTQAPTSARLSPSATARTPERLRQETRRYCYGLPVLARQVVTEQRKARNSQRAEEVLNA